jgi:hypothetical protein
MGISMGGLVARIALRKMELDGVDHQTWKYISVDSPHKGANVPAGLQAAVRHIQNTNLQIFTINVLDYESFEETREVIKLFESKAAQQMLIYSIDKNYSYNNNTHNLFQQEYDRLGFPQRCQNIAVSNGSNNGSLIFPAGSSIIDYYKEVSFGFWKSLAISYVTAWLSLAIITTNYPQLVLNVIPGNAALRVDIDIIALKDKSVSKIYGGKVYIYKKILWLIPVNITLTEKTVNSAASMLPIDGAPGGLYSVDMMGGQLPISNNAMPQKQFCFVPTVSALALSDWQTQLTSNLSGKDFWAQGTSEFDQFFTQSSNEFHTRFNSSATFLYNQLTAPPLQFIENNFDFCGQTTFHIKNWRNAAVKWETGSNFTIGSYNNVAATVSTTGSAGAGHITLKTGSNGVVRKKMLVSCSPSITGPSTVCHSGSTFTLNYAPQGAVQWNVTGSFSMSGATNTSISVAKTGTGNGSGTLTAFIGGKEVARTTIMPCITEITGPSNVSSTTVFTLSNAPSSMRIIVYGVTGPFSLMDNGKDKSVAVNWTGASNSSGTLTAYYSGTAIATKTIVPSGPAISVSCARYMNGAYYAVISIPDGFNAWEYSWNAGGWAVSQYPGNAGGLSPRKAVILTPPSLPASLPHSVTAGVLGSWGFSSCTFNITDATTYTLGTAYSVSASPNPVTDVVNIELKAVETLAEPAAILSDQTIIPVKTRVLQTETSATNATVAAPLQKREAKLYNQSGNHVRSLTFFGDKTQMNVSDLPAGIYYLHVFDGAGEKPEIRQIIVQH